MGTLERRVQVLFAPEQYAQLEQEARRTRQSVGAYIREAVDERLRTRRVDREAAWARLKASAAEGIGPAYEPEELAAELDSYWVRDLP